MLFLGEQIHCFSQTNTELTSTHTTGSHTCCSEPAVCGRCLCSPLDTSYERVIHHARAPPRLPSTDPTHESRGIFPQTALSIPRACAREEDKEAISMTSTLTVRMTVEVMGCPTVCQHCWAMGREYQTMPLEDISWVLHEVRRFCVAHTLNLTQLC